MEVISDRLKGENIEKFNTSYFGEFLETDSIKFQGQLVLHLLFRQDCGLSKEKVVFHINNKEAILNVKGMMTLKLALLYAFECEAESIRGVTPNIAIKERRVGESTSNCKSFLTSRYHKVAFESILVEPLLEGLLDCKSLSNDWLGVIDACLRWVSRGLRDGITERLRVALASLMRFVFPRPGVRSEEC
ncbi:hypothetical protein DH2020_029251 [Rehmannia glutinosa]|uniref:Uncharacterized protein n=1 Tax=Rehmannia glutinosa TaxID=99300 RepID=A0ABR0VP54_REHGL